MDTQYTVKFRTRTDGRFDTEHGNEHAVWAPTASGRNAYRGPVFAYTVEEAINKVRAGVAVYGPEAESGPIVVQAQRTREVLARSTVSELVSVDEALAEMERISA